MIEIIDYILHIFDEKPGLLRLTFFQRPPNGAVLIA